MALLDTITAATATSGASAPAPGAVPIVLNSDAIIPLLSSSESNSTSLITPTPTPVSNWNLSSTDTKIIQSTRALSHTLASHLQSIHPLTHSNFLQLLTSFLTSVSDQIDIKTETSEPLDLIKQRGFLLGPVIANLIAETCASFGLWDVLEALIVNNLLKSSVSFNLVDKLIDKKQSRLLCLFVKHVPDLPWTNLLNVLRYFLSPLDDECYMGMLDLRKEWEKEALYAMEKATNVDIPKRVKFYAKEAAFFLMVSLDGFSSNEICLHYLFGSNNSDSLVLGSAISRLDGSDLTSLVRYLVKWLEKYWNFPDASRIPKLGKYTSVLHVKECSNVPSIGSILKAFGVVLDTNFSYWVLNPDIRDEIKKGEDFAHLLALESGFCAQVGEVIEQLKAKKDEEAK
ncbi:hypothetical protein LUZ62_091217 [Rhynchospora pubera]|uniref:Uncharacterized protein n=1 Tax=Rhynchospora pubera TaxID=906938 RepID=A0AAV8CRJ8_9POAL|nr:hypothetical protein LUZ62_091217 [Rhynchospora pubera]